jgi:hypothetical protein
MRDFFYSMTRILTPVDNFSVDKIAVLFARSDSIYKTLPGTDVYDMERDALTWPGGCPVIAHPPCRAWGRLRAFANPRPGEKELALWAVDQVRAYGGILEHPASSLLWQAACLPQPGKRDEFGGITVGIHQHTLGHRAEKKTLLYIVGSSPADWPSLPLVLDEPTHVIQSRKRENHRPHVSKAEREHTPQPFAEWLLTIARQCSLNPRIKRADER